MTTLVAVIPSHNARVRVAHSLERDLGRVEDWCSMWGMKFNAGKTKTMVVSRSRSLNPPSPALSVDGTVLEDLSFLEILGVTFDSKLTFEMHLRIGLKICITENWNSKEVVEYLSRSCCIEDLFQQLPAACS